MKSYNGFSAAERNAADYRLKKSVASGLWSFERKCQMCSQTDGHIWIHLEDYSRPFEDARPLCVECHMMLHKRLRLPNHWLEYLLFLRDGGKGRVYKTNGAYILANPYPKKDSPRVELVADPTKWWEALPLTEKVRGPC